MSPLLTSKVVNYCTCFHHLCIIEKRRLRLLHSQRLLSFLLATVVMQQKPQSARRDSAHPNNARPTDRTISSSKLYWLRIFREIRPNILVNSSTWGCPWSKIFSPKILFDHGEYVSHNFGWLTATFFVSWGVLRGHKKPLRGVPDPQFPKRFSSWTLDFAGKNLQLDRTKTLTCSLLQNLKN